MISNSTYCAGDEHHCNLTGTSLAVILSPLSPHVTAWFGSHEKKEMPTARLIRRLRFHMQEIIYGGRCLGRESVQGSLSLSTNLDNVHRPKFGSFKRWTLSLKKETNTMSQNNSAQQLEQTHNQAAISEVKLPEEYPVQNRDDFFVLICRTDGLSPTVWRDQLMLMRKNFKAQIGDVVMVNPDHLSPRLEFCSDAGVYAAVCVAAKPQLLEILPDGTVSKAA
ncbi:MAG: hypothetical protein ACXV8Q_04750 [Methylobacter sp.]